MTARGWVGVDFDGTLAQYHGRMQPLGDPVPAMVEKVKRVLDDGTYDVKIFTARAVDPVYVKAVQAWTKAVLGVELPVTATKDFLCVEIWDDRAFHVLPNIGDFLGAVTTPVLGEINLRLLQKGSAARYAQKGDQ